MHWTFELDVGTFQHNRQEDEKGGNWNAPAQRRAKRQAEVSFKEKREIREKQKRWETFTSMLVKTTKL